MSIDLVINFDQPRDRHRLRDVLGTLGGKHRVRITRHRRTRSINQNAYYWAVVVASFHQFLSEQGDSYTAEDCHEMLKFKHLRETAVDHSTGEVLGEFVKSTATLNTMEFAEYVDRCIAWLGEFGIRVPSPAEYSPHPTKQGEA